MKGKKELQKIPLLRYINVFHVSQVDGVEPLKEPLHDVEPIESADKVIIDYVAREHIDLQITKSDRAFYNPSFDRVVIPLKEQYRNANEYYSTAFHELTHSTGHKKRLDRLESKAVAAFGSETYSKEELIVEIRGASILNILGIETPQTFKNSAAYIQNWLQALRNDNRFIIS
ncbi:MAG: zincin-like metallopeptidase domain-containing protein, partial [Clostridium sp.]|nr:zincin-like metallopeptidase domain-containing protein [Clostridium sp.]